MQEVKSPKKPFLYYCLIVATIMVLLNSLVFPNVLEHSVKEVDYNTFMKMTENKEIGKVNIDSGEIIFTDKSEEKMYKTGVMDDPGLVDRLYAVSYTHLGLPRHAVPAVRMEAVHPNGWRSST